MTCSIGESQPLVNRGLLSMERGSGAGSKTCAGGGGSVVRCLGALSAL